MIAGHSPPAILIPRHQAEPLPGATTASSFKERKAAGEPQFLILYSPAPPAHARGSPRLHRLLPVGSSSEYRIAQPAPEVGISNIPSHSSTPPIGSPPCCPFWATTPQLNRPTRRCASLRRTPIRRSSPPKYAWIPRSTRCHLRRSICSAWAEVRPGCG